ncbi:MAG: hypothetical protein ACXVGN_10380 [Mycobacteriaceae bacterium]
MSLSRRVRGAVFFSVCAVSVPAALTFSSAASAANQDTTALTVVSDSTSATAAGWAPQAYDNSDGGDWTDPTQSFALSAGAPLGQGAAFFTMGGYQNQVELYRNTTLDDTKLADVSDLGYSTYQRATSGSGAKQPAYLRLTVDPDGVAPHTDAESLFFQPALNPGQGAIKQGAWQNWDAGTSANWTTTGDESGLTTLAAYQAAHPDATIINNSDGSGHGNFGGLALMAGAAGQNQTYAQIGVDRVTVTSGGKTSLWDFETPAGVNTSRTETVKDTTGSWNESARFYYPDDSQADIDVDQSFVLGPKTPVLGKGSRQLTLGNLTGATQFWRSTALDGKKVDTLRKLGYSTYAEHVAGKAGSDLQQPAYLRLSIDSDGPDADGVISKDTTLNFEPANNADQGAVKNGEWQTWNAFTGQFHVIESPTETADMITLASFMARHPKAVFAANAKDFGGKGALSLVVGSAGDNQRNGRFAVDNVSVGLSSLNAGKPAVASTVYDFEPTYTVPTANYAKRVGVGTVTLTGKAGAGDDVEVRTYKSGNYSTVAGAATANQAGSWSLVIPVRERTYFRAYLAGTYGTTNITSATHLVDVQFGVGLALSTSRGYTYGTVALNPALGSVPVRLETVVNHRWVAVAKGVTASNGKATLKWDSVRGRGYTVRAVASSTGTVLGNYSVSRWVRSS